MQCSFPISLLEGLFPLATGNSRDEQGAEQTTAFSSVAFFALSIKGAQARQAHKEQGWWSRILFFAFLSQLFQTTAGTLFITSNSPFSSEAALLPLLSYFSIDLHGLWVTWAIRKLVSQVLSPIFCIAIIFFRTSIGKGTQCSERSWEPSSSARCENCRLCWKHQPKSNHRQNWFQATQEEISSILRRVSFIPLQCCTSRWHLTAPPQLILTMHVLLWELSMALGDMEAVVTVRCQHFLVKKAGGSPWNSGQLAKYRHRPHLIRLTMDSATLWPEAALHS